MNEVGTPAAGDAPQKLSEWQRVANTFTSPSKTFDDIRLGNRSWWLPWVIIALCSYIFLAAVTAKIGIATVAENQIRLNPKAEERMAQLTPEQRESQMKISIAFTQGSFIASPFLTLLTTAITSAVLLGTINFLFGGRATFGGVFSVSLFAGLPGIVKALLGVLVIYLGAPPEQFNVKNFAPTNPAAFVYPNAADANQALYSLLSSLDFITIWTLILMSMGIAAVAGVKRASGYIAVFGWWAILVLFGVGIAAVFS